MLVTSSSNTAIPEMAAKDLVKSVESDGHCPPDAAQRTMNLSPTGRRIMTDTIFSKIIRREIPADIVYEDDFCLAFRDVAPQAPVHILLIPKNPIVSLASTEPEDHRVLGHMLLKVRAIAEQEGLTTGYRVVTNIGADGGQTVNHLHFHIMGGRSMTWPPG